MTLKKRRIIFYGLILIFIPLSFGIISYSQGWRIVFDIENCKIERLKDCEINFQKTGAAYIETSPKNVIIKLNNKIIPDQSSIIKSGTLVSNLSPKNYKIEIQKDGYLTYHKNIKVQQSIVAELIYTILIPEKFEKITIIEKIKGNEIISLNSKRIIVKNPQNKIFYLYKFNNIEAALNINASFNNLFKNIETIENIELHPFNEDRLLIKTSNGLYIFDSRKLQIETVFKNNKDNKISAWTNDSSNIYYTKCQTSNNKCQIYSYNLITKNEDKIFELSENVLIIADIKLSNNNIAFIDSSHNLSLFNLEDKKIEKIAEKIKKFSFSPNAKKLFFLTNSGEIGIYFIENWYKNSPKIKKEIVKFNLIKKESIKNAYWYKDSYHLFIEYKNENEHSIDFIEIDDRLPLNQYPIVSATESNFYNPEQNLLYFIQNKNLYNVKI